jgi:2,4-dienoyl-CoA reductase-like NADH-dependent reductase (Old Yellow Enzyme family)
MIYHTFENVGNYIVTLKVSANYSSDSASQTVRVTFITDLDENGIVDIIDITAVTKARGSRPGDPNGIP